MQSQQPLENAENMMPTADDADGCRYDCQPAGYHHLSLPSEALYKRDAARID